MFQEFLTTEGERLLAKSITGEATITFTKMELGDGDRGTGSKSIEHLESKRMTLDIYSVRLSGDNHITITSMLKSENIEEGFYLREKGIYATDGTTEVLFMYGTAGSLAEWIDHSSTAVFERTMRTIIALSEGDNISVTIQDGVYASGEDMEQTKTDILTAISDIKLDGDWAKYEQAESILSVLDTFVAAYTVLRAGKLDNLDALVSSRAPANTALSNEVWTNVRAALLDNLDMKISSRAQASTALSNTMWTDARAGKVDNLDTTISSRAQASTALSNAVWTDTRAAKQDNLDTTISSRAAASTALSNAVWTNTRAGYLDYLANGTYGLSAIMTKLNSLFNSGGIPGTVKSVQRGNVNDTSGGLSNYGSDYCAYKDVAITAVNMNKAVVLVNSSVQLAEDHALTVNAKLINSTTLRVYATNYSDHYANNINWQVIDFY